MNAEEENQVKPGNNFMAYDRQFRLKMASSPSLKWNRVDEDLRARFLLRTRVVCFECHSFGHTASFCPLRDDKFLSSPAFF